MFIQSMVSIGTEIFWIKKSVNSFLKFGNNAIKRDGNIIIQANSGLFICGNGD